MAEATYRRRAKHIVERGTHASGKTGGAGLVQSLGRGLSLLDSLAESPDGIPLSDLCQQVGLSLSTAHRLLTTLEQQRYVRCDPKPR
jgi:IclR family acetate operon transcriptional repressor